MKKRKKMPFDPLSKFDEEIIRAILDQEGIAGSVRPHYFAIARKMKSKKTKTYDDLEGIIRDGVKQGAKESALRKIALAVRPDLIYRFPTYSI